MESKWLTGYDFIREVNMNDVDIIEYVINGLQPYDNAMQPMLPLHAAEWTYIIRELREDIEVIEKQFPTIKNSDYSDWSILNLDRVVDDDSNLVKIEFPDGSDSEIRGQYEEKKAQSGKLEIKLNKYSALPSWVGYELPLRKKDRVAVIDQLLNALYKWEDILAFRNQQNDDSHCDLIDTMNAQKAKPRSENFFIRENNDLWHIGFNGQLIRIKHYAGIQYIAHLLDRPETSVSSISLYQLRSGNTTDKIMRANEAIGEGLNTVGSVQAIKDAKASYRYLKKYHKLQNDLDEAESDMERQEIENEMDALLPYIKEKNFTDPDQKKAQSNIIKSCKVAYGAMKRNGMNELVKHLEKYINADGAYGQIYTGSLSWEIIPK